MTTTGFRSPTRDDTTPSRFSRTAAGSSLLLGVTLVAVLPDVLSAAFYVGLLAAVTASLALVGGYVLWSHATIVVRAMATLGAGATLAGELLQSLHGLPGARQLDALSRWEGVAAFLLASAIVLLLLLDARRRGAEDPHEHPYAL